MASLPDEPFYLSPMDNLMPLWQTPMLLLFPIQSSQSGRAIQAFFKGLQTTFEAIPILTGSIKAMPNRKQKGALAVTRPWRNVEDLFIVKDLRDNSKYDYAELRKKSFPPSSFPLLDFTKIEFALDPNPPVMYTQVTLISGGLVLAPLVHHCFTDVTGLATVIRLWASYCAGHLFCEKDKIDQGSKQLSRNPFSAEPIDAVIEEFPEYRQLDTAARSRDSSHIRYVGEPKIPTAPRSFSKVTHRIWALSEALSTRLRALAIPLFLKLRALNKSTTLLYFPYSNLRRLKALAEQGYEDSDTTTWISTMDALSSLIYCCVAESRNSARLADSRHRPGKHTYSLFGRLIKSLQGVLKPWISSSHVGPAKLNVVANARKRCHGLVPPDFIGNVLLWANIQSGHDEVKSSIESVSTQAKRLRTNLLKLDHVYFKRNLAALHNVPDLSRIATAASSHEGKGLCMSSWRDEDLCSLDWGPAVGVHCERVRICEFFVDGMVITFPSYVGAQPNGGLEVFLSLESKVLKKLKSNAFFNQYAQWR